MSETLLRFMCTDEVQSFREINRWMGVVRGFSSQVFRTFASVRVWGSEFLHILVRKG